MFWFFAEKIIFLMIAIAYLIMGYLDEGLSGLVTFFAFLLLPFFCIWFSDAMGGYTGPTIGWEGSGRYITSESPGCLIKLFGWILLLLPVIVGLLFFRTELKNLFF